LPQKFSCNGSIIFIKIGGFADKSAMKHVESLVIISLPMVEIVCEI
jgi:hypothetical protein